MRRSSVSVLALFGLALAPSAHAQEWRWSVTPYLWGAGVEQKTAVNSSLPTVGIELDFEDIIDEAQFVFAGKFEGSDGRLHFIGEISYADIGSATVLDNPVFTAASVGSEAFLGTGAFGYRVVDTGNYWIDGVVGIRYTWTKTDLSFNLANGAVVSGGEDENWGDGFVGVRGSLDFAPQWSLVGYGDIGAGWSDYTWQLYTGVSYELNQNTSLFGGYRAYKDEYDNDGYLYSVLQSGPIARRYVLVLSDVRSPPMD